MDEIAEALTDLREEIARLPRWNDDHVGIYRDDQRGRYLLRDDVLGVSHCIWEASMMAKRNQARPVNARAP